MTRFNAPLKNRYAAVNYEGEKAFTYPQPERELYAIAATTVLNDTFYQSWKDREELLKKLVGACSYRFVADLAYYLRKEFHLRSIPLWLLWEKSRTCRLLPEDIAKVLQRADEVTELLALYQAEKQSLTPLPAAVRKGIKLAMQKFNAYQFRKYDKQGKGAVTFQDVMRMIRPKPANAEMSELFRQLAKDELPPIETWETLKTAAGNDPEARKAVWEKLIAERKLPYMAAVRNLRNMIKDKVSEKAMEDVIQFITDPAAVIRSQMFPFRFYSAYRFLLEEMFESQGIVMDPIYNALDVAAVRSLDNVLGAELFKGKTLIACDVSGSMNQKTLSPKGKITPMDVGLVLGHIVKAVNPNSILGTYATEWKVKQPRTVLHDAYKARSSGGATYGQYVLQWAYDKKIKFDRLFFFSDNQTYSDLCMGGYGSWGTNDAFRRAWHKYKGFCPEAKLYMFDLMGYATVPVDMREKDVYLASGWSEAIFKVISDIESGKKIEEIVRQGGGDQ